MARQPAVIRSRFRSFEQWGEWINVHAVPSDGDGNRAVLIGTGGRPATREELIAFVAEQNALRTRAQARVSVPEAPDLDPAKAFDALAVMTSGSSLWEGSPVKLVALDAKTIANLDIGSWRTLAGDIDVLLVIPRSGRAELVRCHELGDQADILEIAGAKVAVATLDDLIRPKEIANPSKDRAAVVELRKLLAPRATVRDRTGIRAWRVRLRT